ncbi:MAG: YebC/PmpR family DNA-binding transcriptional regulator [Oscillospiraceae bacterium]|nr:YebC/PmpR family DNA-binding transcriptional regulator [Oscillospiraceae bacterium]
MAGHSKWNNIKRKKGEKDNARAKIFTKISREILVCIRENGSADPNVNYKLRDLISKAKSNNIPSDNIERLLKKAQGGEKNDYETCVYEGYGPGGVAVLVSCLTDNRNRTAGEVRHYFDKYGGNLGTAGCVSFMFSEKGVAIVDNEDEEISPDTFMEHAIESGAEDYNFDSDGGVIEVYTAANEAARIGEVLATHGYKILSAQNEQIPSTYTEISGNEDDEQFKKMTLLLEMLEDNDDVQNVWHNGKI